MLLIGFRDGKETEPFWLKPLLIKEMFYAFSRKNKVFYKISGIDRYLSSCYLIGCQVFDGASENRGSSGGDCLILHTPDEGRQPGTIHDHTKGVAAAIY